MAVFARWPKKSGHNNEVTVLQRWPKGRVALKQCCDNGVGQSENEPEQGFVKLCLNSIYITRP